MKLLDATVRETYPTVDVGWGSGQQIVDSAFRMPSRSSPDHSTTVATASLSLVAKGGWPVALFLFMAASVGYYSANVFYDSLIVDVSHPSHYSLVSSLGFSLGYFGGASLLALHVWMLSDPTAFGFVSTDGVIRFAFVSVAIWWGGARRGDCPWRRRAWPD